jgi:hypothetical protein
MSVSLRAMVRAMEFRHDYLYLIVVIVSAGAYMYHTVASLVRQVKAGTETKQGAVSKFVLDPRTLAVVGMMLLWFLGASVHRLSAVIAADASKHVDSALSSDETLASVFEPVIGKMRSNIDNLPKHKFAFSYGNLFTSAYLRVLQRYPTSHFYAVTSPTKTHVWPAPENAPIYAAMRQFTDRGGMIDRIFVVDDPADISVAQLGVIQCHQESGVTTRVVRRGSVEDHDLRFVLVEGENRFGWEAKIVMGDTITDIDTPRRTRVS